VGRVWSSAQELIYYVVSPGGLVLGRPRGAADRVAWLLGQQRYEAALEMAGSERRQQPEMYEQVGCGREQGLRAVGCGLVLLARWPGGCWARPRTRVVMNAKEPAVPSSREVHRLVPGWRLAKPVPPPPSPWWLQVVLAYLEHLVSQQQYQLAADRCPGLLLDLAPLWERLVYIFAQARQLALLAPLLPTREPQLRPVAYDLALAALLHSPAHHAQLLLLLRAWPGQLYSQGQLVEEVGGSGGRGGGRS
jgi:hypothetical protein